METENTQTPSLSAANAENPGGAPDILAHLETIVAQQKEEAKKTQNYRRLVAGLLAALVLVLAVGLFSLQHTVATATEDLPKLIQTTTRTVDELGTQLEALDLEALNNTVQGLNEGLSQINFEALNTSIENLAEVVEKLSSVTRIFS